MKRLAAILALIAAIASAVALALADFEWGPAEDQTPATVTEVEKVIPIPGPTPDVTLPAEEGLTPELQEQASEIGEPDTGPGAHAGTRDETPPGVSADELEQVDETPPGIGPPQPTGGAELLSCPFRGVANKSSRAGARVSMVVLHYTVSDPGTLDAIRNLFNTPSFQASSHLGLEPSGRCERWVRYEDKAWTNGAFNPVTDTVEIICCRTDPSRAWWLAQPIIKNGLLASWIVDRLRARGLPAKLVDPSGCTPRAGWTDHNRLECGNTHTDVGRNFPFDVVSKQVAQLMNPGPTTKVVWQITSGGQVIRQTDARTTKAGNGYDRLLAWARGAGEARLKQLEDANGHFRVRKVTVPIP